MVQKLSQLQKEILFAEQWKEERVRHQTCAKAACHGDKEILLHREMARLRLKLKLGRASCGSHEDACVN